MRELVSANERQSELAARVHVGCLWVSIRVLFERGGGRLRQNESPWVASVRSGSKSMDSIRSLVQDGPPFLAQILASRLVSFLRKIFLFSPMLWAIFDDFLCTYGILAYMKNVFAFSSNRRYVKEFIWGRPPRVAVQFVIFFAPGRFFGDLGSIF